jgi:hypothetical protein
MLYLYTVDLGLVYVAAGGLALQVRPDVSRPVDPTVRPAKSECRHCFGSGTGSELDQDPGGRKWPPKKLRNIVLKC